MKRVIELYKFADPEPGALERLGEIYAKGDGVPKNPKESVRHFRKARGILKNTFKSTRPDGDWAFRLGRLHEEGKGGPKNQEEALRCYDFAANLGHQEAQKAITRLTEERKRRASEGYDDVF